MAESLTIKQKKDTIVEVKCVITKGKLLAMLGALRNHDTTVGKDLKDMLERALINSDLPDKAELLLP